ncbi:hypothetical protein HBI18_040700 [Parastagonospora nodorum]|nr:hypothetical protein HBH77_029570 [Parastagonospora nodorum]KAH5742449.1 hypothetical protein HBI18_040700 [Parastagonospora nodorum]
MNKGGTSMVLNCQLGVADQIELFSSQALVDSGSDQDSFIDSKLVRSKNMPTEKLLIPRALDVVDGTPISSGPVTHRALVDLVIGVHHERKWMYVTKLGHYPVILGHPWLKQHNPVIDWGKGVMTFSSHFCEQRCLPDGWHDVRILGRRHPERPPPPPPDETQPGPEIREIGAAPFKTLCVRARRTQGYKLFAANLRDIEIALSKKDEVPIDPKTKLPEYHWDEVDLFSKTISDLLPPSRPGTDHRILLQPGAIAPNGPLYGMSRDELLVLRDYLRENLDKGFIRASSSSAASPVLFVKKPGGGLRFCVDYRGLNAVTIKDRYPIPLIQETLSRLSKAKIFTKLDVIAAFNKLRIADGDEEKTAFKTRLGLFEYLVVPFGLSNAPASFQRFINGVLGDSLDQYVTCYLDDILIYSDSVKEHKKHVATVLRKLREAGLQCDIKKSEFYVTETQYLGLIISTHGIKMCPSKIRAVVEWEPPRNLKDVQAFLGFANFYRRFIPDFSGTVKAMVALTKKGVLFHWDDFCQQGFDKLKAAFVRSPVLAHFDPDKPCLVETDSSDYVNAGVLSQHDDDNILRPVAYYSSKLTPAECNYEIYDKELLAIIKAFEYWRAELEGSPHIIEVLSDHKNLEYFMSTKQLSRRQARWSLFLSRFNFVIKYRPGIQGTKPDSLTRRSQDLPHGDEDPRVKHQHQTILKSYNVDPTIRQPLKLAATQEDESLFIPEDDVPPRPNSPTSDNPEQADPPSGNESEGESIESPETDTLVDEILQASESDEFAQDLLEALRTGQRDLPPKYRTKDNYVRVQLGEFSEPSPGLLYYRQQVYVPDNEPLRTKVISLCHELPTAGHKGWEGTYSLLHRDFWWPRYDKDVQRFVRNCVCQQVRPDRQSPRGFLRPLDVPYRRWGSVSLDFVSGFPPSGKEKYDNVLVVACRMSKLRHYFPCHKTITARQTADLWIQHIFRLHGAPDEVVSDRGPQFVAAFKQRLWQRLNVKSKLSTAYHPQTDGQTEAFNREMIEYLRYFVTKIRSAWHKQLWSAEYSANASFHKSIGMSPFEATYGEQPKIGFEPARPITVPSREVGSSVESADRFVDKMQKVLEHCKGRMAAQRSTMEYYANAHRRPALRYRTGDWVLLKLPKDAKTGLESFPKLLGSWMGPFRVLEQVAPLNYRLELPIYQDNRFNIHPIFHVDRLKLAPNDNFPSQTVRRHPLQPLPPNEASRVPVFDDAPTRPDDSQSESDNETRPKPKKPAPPKPPRPKPGPFGQSDESSSDDGEAGPGGLVQVERSRPRAPRKKTTAPIPTDEDAGTPPEEPAPSQPTPPAPREEALPSSPKPADNREPLTSDSGLEQDTLEEGGVELDELPLPSPPPLLAPLPAGPPAPPPIVIQESPAPTVLKQGEKLTRRERQYLDPVSYGSARRKTETCVVCKVNKVATFFDTDLGEICRECKNTPPLLPRAQVPSEAQASPEAQAAPRLLPDMRLPGSIPPRPAPPAPKAPPTSQEKPLKYGPGKKETAICVKCNTRKIVVFHDTVIGKVYYACKRENNPSMNVSAKCTVCETLKTGRFNADGVCQGCQATVRSQKDDNPRTCEKCEKTKTKNHGMTDKQPVCRACRQQERDSTTQFTCVDCKDAKTGRKYGGKAGPACRNCFNLRKKGEADVPGEED